ncbi:MAG: hypothetical protein IT379_27430 [Deltaproteobacteria bacterium]|nr:hypothetical protein [Deltaproteobacteria bacterium]
MQINLHVTERFERALRRFMKARGLANKSEAIRVAVEEAAERESRKTPADFAALRGAALKAPLSERPKFRSEDDLWREPTRTRRG